MRRARGRACSRAMSSRWSRACATSIASSAPSRARPAGTACRALRASPSRISSRSTTTPTCSATCRVSASSTPGSTKRSAPTSAPPAASAKTSVPRASPSAAGWRRRRRFWPAKAGGATLDARGSPGVCSREGIRPPAGGGWVNLRILFVEDSADDAELMLRRLREAGIEPHWERVQTEAALREALAGERWELALVDYNLPGFGGLEALAVLAAEAPDVPAITVSGAITEEMAVATITAGAVDYVLKDNLTRLAPAVRRAVEGAELRRQQRRAAEQARQTMYAIEHSSQAIVYVSEGGVILYINAAAHRLGGVPPAEAVGQEIWGWSPTVDETRWGELWRAAAQHPIVDFEATVRLAGGEERLISATLDYHERDEDSFVIVYARDITEQREVEERAAESEARYRRLADNAPDIIFRYDFLPTMDLTYINPAIEAITGYTPDECYADPQLMLTMVHPDDAALMAGMMEPLSPPDEPMLMRWIGKDGVTRWMESRIVPVRDSEGRLLAVEGITRDVTERRQAEEALRRREREFSTLVENAPDMIVRYDTDLRYVYCNTAVERQMRVPARTLIGKTPLETGAPREQAEFICQSLRQVLQTRDELEVEQSYPLPSGQRHFATRIVPERDEQGSTSDPCWLSPATSPSASRPRRKCAARRSSCGAPSKARYWP